MHETGCASARTGWLPQYLTLHRAGALAGAMPLYLKSHSRGEYVFDWAWADAYERHGLAYYPKLLAAIPFSPVGAHKLLAVDDAARAALAQAALACAHETSSLHVLFPSELERAHFADQGMMLRHGVQFHWANDSYRDFEDFLARFGHDKRKKINQERRKVRDAGIEFARKTGADIREEDWAFFNRCYRTTYREHHSSPYLSLDFFRRIGAEIPEHTLLVIAYRAGQPIASAFNLYSPDVLYGRYWGSVEFHPALHFETCYYQALEFCIERKIGRFEGGAQGEHKLARGFMPEKTYSAHWLKHPQFADAVEKFLQREAQGIAGYVDALREHAPYKADPG